MAESPEKQTQRQEKSDAGSPVSVATSSSSASSNEPLCRICKDSGRNERLVTPCNCSGSMAFVHLSCLENWLTVGNRTQCEVCKYLYDTKVRPLSCIFWMLHPGSLRACGPFWLVMILALFTIIAALLVYVCFFVSQHYSNKQNSKGLYITYFLMFVIYVLFYAILVHLFFRRVKWWMENHQVVQLVSYRTNTSEV